MPRRDDRLGQQTVVLIDRLAEFVAAYPAWVGADGWPLSWAHYVFGMRQLVKATSREMLRALDVATTATAEKQYRDEFIRTHKSLGGM